MHVVCITTTDYALNAIRLCSSLKRVHPLWRITVYLDHAKLETIFLSMGCETKILAEIKEWGVKRAKFFAYADAIKSGSFLYLDADIIVLKTLDELVNADCLVACRDYMTECLHFIENPSKPWVNRPELSGDSYFNSGVFYAPGHLRGFFEDCLEAAKNDQEWNSLIIANYLYDNHFLCAKVAERRLPTKFVSEYEFNWQGLHVGGELKAAVDNEGNLYHMDTGQILRLVHFAGVLEIDHYIQELPVNIQEILAHASSYHPVGILEFISSKFWKQTPLEGKVKQILLSPFFSGEMQKLHSQTPGSEQAYVPNAPALRSIASSAMPSKFVWNGLLCGGAYLYAIEYYELRKFIKSLQLNRILEIGAGYTSVLFNRISTRVISIENWRGSWLDFALENGCDVRVIPFESARNGFELSAFQKTLTEFAGGIQLIFIDSPPGTDNRMLVAKQVIQFSPDADYYAVHDSIRDASVVYNLCRDLNLEIIKHVPSLRGLTFLARRDIGKNRIEKITAAIKYSSIDQAAVQAVEKIKFDVQVKAIQVFPDVKGGAILSLRLINNGLVVIPLIGDEKLLFSFHLQNLQGNVVQWDNPRYELPANLDPEDYIEFDIQVHGFVARDTAVAFDFVWEGSFWWSMLTGQECPKFYG